MASKKDKLLDSAQRFVLKGQLDRAIKDYQQIVALEPKEIRYRQKLAELLVRDDRREEAIAQYEDIGRHYADNSYFLKAIAVYKQIQRLAPGNNAISLTLASLNHKQGLIGNAMAEYGQVVEQFEREGAPEEALKVLESMIEVDGDHAATRLKYAELLLATGARDASRRAFSALLGKLRRAGHAAAAQKVSNRLGQLFPGHREDDADAVQPAAVILEDDTGQSPIVALPEVQPSPKISPKPGASRHSKITNENQIPLSLAAGTETAPAEATSPTTAEEELPSAFDAPWTCEPQAGFVSAPPSGNAADLTSAWEEEIELNLDDTLPEAFAETAPDFGTEATQELELSLDFSLALDFDEVATDSAPVSFPGFDSSAPGGQLSKMSAPEADEPGPLRLAFPEEDGDPEAFDCQQRGMDSEQGASAGELRSWQKIYPELTADSGTGMDAEELESHYDLGIGYKEMGLYDAAINEFAVAAASPRRRFDCLTLQSICYREKGDREKAEELLRRGRDLEVLSAEQRICLSYELAFLLESAGSVDEAIALYREVKEANPAFYDVGRRLSQLAGDDSLDIIDLEWVETDS